ncbi:MAG: hypothetical protein KAT91_00545 [Candidatus Aenigmarchaeota archaeon]|nr:hypothetical protein [Candidatus Aenigmarchaeota archaeon]
MNIKPHRKKYPRMQNARPPSTASDTTSNLGALSAIAITATSPIALGRKRKHKKRLGHSGK